MVIEPDTKNWTWVLERPCPECGLDAGAVPLAEVGPMVRADARAWQDVLTRPDVRRRPREDVWSPLEYACHVRDVFRVFDQRLVLMLTLDDPLFANWDQDATAIESDYAAQDPAVVSRELTEAADVVAGRFEAVTPEQRNRPGHRDDGSEFTVSTIGRYFVHDWVHHLHDVSGTA